MNYLKEMAEQGYHKEDIGPFHRTMIPWLLRTHHITPEMKIVDIGAGQGHCLIPLYQSGWRHLVAVDMEDYNFAAFREKYGAQTLQCDMATQPLSIDSNSVDAVISFHVIEHLPKPNNFLQEIHRILKPGGMLFLVTPDWRKQYKTFWRDPTHVKPYDKESIARLLRMFGLQPTVYSWNARFGLGTLQAYRCWPRLGMVGEEMLAVARKP